MKAWHAERLAVTRSLLADLAGVHPTALVGGLDLERVRGSLTVLEQRPPLGALRPAAVELLAHWADGELVVHGASAEWFIERLVHLRQRLELLEEVLVEMIEGRSHSS
ncbi:MAG: hypothetical protein IPJ34_43970 [Myxococcales bacterium]|nr:hypothetical protein [Myxococcales bacterium]